MASEVFKGFIQGCAHFILVITELIIPMPNVSLHPSSNCTGEETGLQRLRVIGARHRRRVGSGSGFPPFGPPARGSGSGPSLFGPPKTRLGQNSWFCKIGLNGLPNFKLRSESKWVELNGFPNFRLKLESKWAGLNGLPNYRWRSRSESKWIFNIYLKRSRIPAENYCI
jgi:hypothetical protein